MNPEMRGKDPVKNSKSRVIEDSLSSLSCAIEHLEVTCNRMIQDPGIDGRMGTQPEQPKRPERTIAEMIADLPGVLEKFTHIINEMDAVLQELFL
jgi:hypothetical protein